MKVYAGYNNEFNKIKKSASGGIAIALYEYCIDNGFLVVGASYTEDMYGADYILTNKHDEIKKFQGSKYFFVKKGDIYSKVINKISNGNKVLFIGLPCEVAAIKRIKKNINGNNVEKGQLLTADLVCHGATYPEIHKEYIKYLERKYKSKAISVNTRKVKKHWEQPYLEVVFENGKLFSKQLYDTEFGYFFSRLCRRGCFNCKFKGENSQADLTLGDFWGANENDVSFNKYGTSIVMCHTSEGENLIKKCKSISLFSITLEEAVKRNQNILHSKSKSERYEIINKNFKKYGVIKGARKSYSFKEKVRIVVKKCIPSELIYLIKWRNVK